MARRVFFSFHYSDDIFQVQQIRNSWRLRPNGSTQPFVDKAQFEKLKLRGDPAVRTWIDRQMIGCGVLAVLIGERTHLRPWVQYEVAKAARERMGILGIHLGGMKTQPSTNFYSNFKKFGPSPSPLFKLVPSTVFEYAWVGHNGYQNMEQWVSTAASSVGR